MNSSDSIATTPPQNLTPPNQSKNEKPKPDSEPDWVNKENRRFYIKLVDDSELLAHVIEAIDLHPKDNAALAESLVSAGLHKQDGTAFDSPSMSRIRKVAKNLNTVTGLTQD